MKIRILLAIIAITLMPAFAVEKASWKVGVATAVITPEESPRFNGEPRPDSAPSSEAASVKPMEIPAPTDAASPT